MTGERTEAERAQLRRAAIVIAAAIFGWMALSAIGGELGLPVRFALLLDMLCLAALGWALWAIFRVWRAGAGKGS